MKFVGAFLYACLAGMTSVKGVTFTMLAVLLDSHYSPTSWCGTMKKLAAQTDLHL